MHTTSYLQLINGRYLLHEKLGQGGMGIVHRATDRLTGETVALKQVFLPVEQILFASQPISQTNRELRLALAHEFQTLAGLRHPNIISVLDYGFDKDQQPFFTMSYLEGARTIVAAANGRSLPQKITLLMQILEALAYLHRRGILHRDLKPDNVLVVGDTVRVLDFGLAAAKEQATDSVGSWLYMAPEVLLGQPATEASDLYSVGVLAYRLLAGTHPFDIYAEDTIGEILDGEPDWSKIKGEEALTAVIRTLLAKKPENRYATANQAIAAFCQALRQPLPPETAVIRESYLQAASFVGRDAELAHLTAELNRLQNSQTAVWLIGGESGIGKSRLIEELRTYALIRGWQVLRGQAIAEGGAYFQLWRDIVPRLILSTPITEFEAGILRQITPHISQLLGRDVPDLPGYDSANGQHKLVRTLLALLQKQTLPTLLLLEDLHWSIECLLPLQEILSDLNATNRLMIVATYRDDEKPTLPQTLDGANLLKLERFDQGKITELCQAMLGTQASIDKLVPRLIQETEGNTYFLVEVMRALAEEAGQLAAIDQETLPTSILTQGMEQILQQRIYKMLDSDQEMLQLAAVAGRQLDMKLLKTLKPDNTFFEGWLQRAAEAAILIIRDNQWLFAHDKLREAMLLNLDQHDRQWLHEQIALTVEAVYPNNRDYYRKLVEHWHAAQNVDKELHYLPAVAEHLIIELDAYPDAIRLLERGLQAVPDTDSRIVSLLNWLAHVHLALSEVDMARQYAKQAQTLAQAAGNWAELGMSLMHLGGVAWYTGDLSQAQEYYEQCLAIFEKLDNHRYTARSHRYLAIMHMYQDRITVAQEHSEKALALFEVIHDQWGIMLIVSDLADLVAEQGEYEKSVQYCERTYELAIELGNQLFQAVGTMKSGMGHFYQGHPAKAKGLLLQALEISQKINHPLVAADIHRFLGIVAYAMQSYTEALTYLQASLAYGKSVADQQVDYSFLKLLIRAYLHVDMEKARECLQQAFSAARPDVEDEPDYDFVLVWVKYYLMTGNPWQAAALLGRCPEGKGPFEKFFFHEMQRELEKCLPTNELQAALSVESEWDWGREREQLLAVLGSGVQHD
ncbi:MAG: tetratricopeptide repeat protein [Ardenticatenaceae bacterium]|nr:tetratricopeptide repeat protein [Ardenticatenaceae bacterium]